MMLSIELIVPGAAGTATRTPGCATHSGIELLFWREGRKLQDTIEVALPDKYAQLPVTPDASLPRRMPKAGRAFSSKPTGAP